MKMAGCWKSPISSSQAEAAQAARTAQTVRDGPGCQPGLATGFTGAIHLPRLNGRHPAVRPDAAVATRGKPWILGFPCVEQGREGPLPQPVK
jgi:hypothetical protein